MGKTNQYNIEKDKILTEQVRAHPCLHDKSRFCCKNASHRKNRLGLKLMKKEINHWDRRAMIGMF